MINDLRDLKALFKLCRQQGVNSIKLNGVEINFGEMPVLHGTIQEQQSSEDQTNPYANFPQGDLTPEQLMFYSAGGHPDDDPTNKDVQ
jgi:hypothetical protein